MGGTVTASGQEPSRTEQLLAVAAVVAAELAVVIAVLVLVGNVRYLVLGLVGLLLALAGAWWTAVEPMPRRAVGIGAVVLGAAAIVISALAWRRDEGSALPGLVAVAVLVAAAGWCARAAVAGGLHRAMTPASPRRDPPARPVLLCNPWSGGGKVESFGLVELASSLGIETVLLDHGLDLEALARDAVARGADCLGMAGGDGSQALVASIAVEHDLPFVCVAAGTRNHFALDLGLDREDPRASVHAFRDAVERRVDYATVNGRFFVNNVSLGVYATIVQQEGYREAKSETTRRLLPELLGSTEHPFDLQFETPDGAHVDGAFLIMVSNNPYVLGASLDLSQRRRLDSGRLGIFAVTAATGSQAAQVVSLALAHKSASSGHAYEFTTDAFEVRSRSGSAFAGIDGEALELGTPLTFRIHSGGLRLLVPEGNLEIAARRQARDARLRDLAAIALGNAPRYPAPV